MEMLLLEKGDKLGDYFSGYERCYRKLKDHPWLRTRIIPFNQFFKKLNNDFETYKNRTVNAIIAYKKWERNIHRKYEISEITSNDGLGKKDNVSYFGDYYGKILFLINLLGIIGAFAAFALAIYGSYYTGGFYHYFFLIIGIVFILWYAYHFRLLKRNLIELRYQPFSIDAHYDMWQWAIQRLQKND